MYTLSEIFVALVIALILGALSFIMVATAMMAKAGFKSAVRVGRRVRVQAAAWGWERRAELLVARVGALIS